jgi:hypothetical protein
MLFVVPLHKSLHPLSGFSQVGLKTLELDKDRAAIDAGKKEDLPAVIGTLIKAVEAGELDTQILQLSPPKPPKEPKQAKAPAKQ